jgi:protein lin-54
MPGSSRKVTYEIGPNGAVSVVKSEGERKEAVFSQLFGKWEGCKIELGQLNSIQLTRNNRFQDMLKDNPFVSIQAPPARSEHRRKLKCNCRKSKCLKLYCECFANALFCGKDCECHNCANVELNAKRLDALREENNSKRSELKGCRCTKSNCQKKYCDCFNRGLPCSSLCACEHCENASALS